jgi:invasion protein IalB
MIRLLARVSCALVALNPVSAFAEYPRYLNVMPPPPPPGRPVTPPQGATAPQGVAPQMAGSIRATGPAPQAAAPVAALMPRAPNVAPVDAMFPVANGPMAGANPTSSAPVPARVAMPAPNSPPTPPAPEVPSLKENSGAWVLQCWSAPTKRCEILQQRVDASSQKQMLLIGFSINPRAAPRLTMVTPIGLKTRATLPLIAEKETLVEAPLKGCIASGCVHILDVSPDQVARLAGAKEAGALVQLPDDRLAKIALDIDGLASGVEKAVKFVK